MAVINPIKVIITNYPKDQTEKLDANNHPDNSAMGTREIAFCREIYIDKDDYKIKSAFHELKELKEENIVIDFFIDETSNISEILRGILTFSENHQ